MNNYIVDLTGVYSADDFHKVLRETLPLPDYYGDNLDALYDVFTEWSGPSRIEFQNTGEMEAFMPKYLRALKRLCEDAAEENPELEILL